MKKIYGLMSVMLVFGLTGTVNAQWVTTGTANSLSLSNPAANRHLFLENTNVITAPLKLYLSGNSIGAGLQIGRDDGGHSILMMGNTTMTKKYETLTIKGTGAADATNSNYIAFRMSDNSRLGYLGDGSNGGSTMQLVGDHGIQLNGLGNPIYIKDNTEIEGTLLVDDGVGIVEVKGPSNPAFLINDTGQAENYKLMGLGTRMSIKYGNTNIFSVDNSGGVIISTDGSPDLTSGSILTVDGNQDISGTLDVSGRITTTNTISNLNSITDIGQQLELGTAAITTLRFDADAWRLYSGGTGASGELFRVQENGNVGIGIASPTYKLDVNGSMRAKGQTILDGYSAGTILTLSATSQTARSWGLGIYDGVSDLTFKDLYTDTDFINLSATNSLITLAQSTSIDGSLESTGSYKQEASNPTLILNETDVSDNNYDIQTNGGAFRIFNVNDARTTFTEKFQVLSNGKMNFLNGNVGIGTSTPDSKLTVAGTVKSQEVIVETTAGADFVFEDNYDLPTLAQIEQFIKANKHLEGIASAEEMKANGVKMGEFQIKLLQKIEELTLYTIDQDKKLNTQEQALNKEKSANLAQQELIVQLLKRIEKLEKKEN